MLVYIIHSDKIYTFRLPKTISGSFILSDYDNNGSKRNLLSIISKDDAWYFKSSDDAKIIESNNVVDESKLVNYRFYKLRLLREDNVFLYVLPGFSNDFLSFDVMVDSKITIGKGTDISFTAPEANGLNLELYFKDYNFFLFNKNTKIPIYVNNELFIEGKLNNFDEIFIMGLKIIVVGKTILINGPKDFISVNSKNLAKETGLLAKDNIEVDNVVHTNFFDNNEFFSKSPVFKKKIKHEEFEITTPQAKEEKYHSPILLDIVPSGLMCLTSVLSGFYTLRSYSKGQTDKESVVTAIVMCVVMLFISLVWPFIERFVTAISFRFNEYRRVKVYRNYLKGKRSALEKIYTDQKAFLEFNNISLNECLNIINTRSPLLFSRNSDSDDFLDIRLGVGDIPLDLEFNYERPDFIQSKDVLYDEIDKLIGDFKYIKDGPFVFSFNKNSSLSVIGKRNILNEYMKTILLQLLVFHDYNCLKVVVLTNKDESILKELKNLSYCFDSNNEFRYFADNLVDAESISTNLYREYLNRKNMLENNAFGDNNKYKTPYYLIISDNIETYKNLKIVSELMSNSNNLGFGIMMFTENLSNVPEGCNNFINLDDKNATLFKPEMDENTIKKFVPEFIDKGVNFNSYLIKLNNIPIKVNNEIKKNLPEKYGFLEMFGVGNVEQLNSINRWKNSNIINSLATPVGIDSSLNTLYLDLHEAKHGPHGLIAGMTGSGKSEFIISYILSMAVNYSPEEVQFVLIDYKGGGLAGAFENRKTGIKLPHLVGTITNLDTSSMNRSLTSIDSEVKRRQKLFNEVKENLNSATIDIYKYQKLYRDGLIKEPLAHLFIICDEFAELKVNQPDFMDKLISIARIGRSLGVHLILSTQKPSGIVDDQIWSNAKFKVCCKVQTSEDSNEMIRKPDAAYLKEAGRFYLQVGYDEIYVLGQSAYSGVSYVSSDTIVQDYSKAIEYIDNIGSVYKSTIVNDDVVRVSHDGDELKNVLEYIIKCSNECNIKTSNLWLDSIPEVMYFKDLLSKYPVKPKKYIIETLIGEYDDPSSQKKGPVSIDITSNGNLFVSGITGSGKTTFLQSFIFSTILNHSTDEVNFYVVDFISDSLRVFEQAPQVGNVIGNSDTDKINKLFYFLENEINNRKRIISLNDGTYLNAVNYNNVSMPNIIVIINGIDVFKDSYDDLYGDLFIPLSRDGSRFGISFIVTGVSSISLASNVEGNFPQKIGLQFTDSSEYNMLFANSEKLVPHENPGRGLVKLDKLYEFQTAKIGDVNTTDRDVTFVIEDLKTHYKKAKSIPIMPRLINSDLFKGIEYDITGVPIGIEIKSNCNYYYDFSSFITNIYYGNYNYVEDFIISLTKLLNKANKTTVIVLDAMGNLEVDKECKCFDSNFGKVIPAIFNNIDQKKKENSFDENIAFIVNGYDKLEKHLKEMRLENINIKTISDLIDYTKELNNYKFVIFDSVNNAKPDNYEWFDLFDSSNGILFDVDPDEQNAFDFEDDYDNVKITKAIAIVIKNNKKKSIKYSRR